ncbi:hypothetical protein B0A48_02443 [Cryoendolithus antarcticus]|uniref:RRM domain-containing protein n=1 Tax=Cryoendolithus antarcticus TaxID=1507870 RepID=A0A1V8TNM6_9PEZI|nr:hypothetical protein B0A48_02443 [Cryoendolithus antarcticus]
MTAPLHESIPSRDNGDRFASMDFRASLPDTATSTNSPPSHSSPSSPSSKAATKQSGQRIPPLREILAIKSTPDRIQAYSSARETFAHKNTGLNDWISAMMAQHPEHADITSRPPLNPSQVKSEAKKLAVRLADICHRVLLELVNCAGRKDDEALIRNGSGATREALEDGSNGPSKGHKYMGEVITVNGVEGRDRWLRDSANMLQIWCHDAQMAAPLFGGSGQTAWNLATEKLMNMGNRLINATGDTCSQWPHSELSHLVRELRNLCKDAARAAALSDNSDGPDDEYVAVSDAGEVISFEEGIADALQDLIDLSPALMMAPPPTNVLYASEDSQSRSTALGYADIMAENVATQAISNADDAIWKGIRATLTRECVSSAYSNRAAVVLAKEESHAADAIFALRDLNIGMIYTLGFKATSSMTSRTQHVGGIEDLKRITPPFVIVSILPTEMAALITPLFKYLGSNSPDTRTKESGSGRGVSGVFLDLSNGTGSPDIIAAATARGWTAYGVTVDEVKSEGSRIHHTREVVTTNTVQRATSAFRPDHVPNLTPARNPPCNTVVVDGISDQTSEDELANLFNKQPGYRRLCYRTKHSGPTCLVEFEDVSFAAKALDAFSGSMSLNKSTDEPIRLSFAKSPLGVRSEPLPKPRASSRYASENRTMLINSLSGLSAVPAVDDRAWTADADPTQLMAYTGAWASPREDVAGGKLSTRTLAARARPAESKSHALPDSELQHSSAARLDKERAWLVRDM